MPHNSKRLWLAPALTGFLLSGGLLAAGPAHAVPISFAVTNTGDSNDGACTTADTGNGCSLREAINAANAAGGNQTITFDSGVTGSILLGSSLPDLTANINILGPGANLLAIDGQGTVKILKVTSTSSASISGLTFQNGYDSTPQASDFNQGGGGAIEVVDGNLTVDACSFLNNTSSNEGGAINDYGTVTVTNSTFSGNTAYIGGALNVLGNGYHTGLLSLTNVTLAGNIAFLEGGGIEQTGTLTINNCTITGNFSPVGGGIDDLNPLIINNSLVAQNNSVFSAPDFKSQAFISASYNFIGGDPKFDPAGLQYNGGSTKTIGLLPSSPCINAGDPAYAGEAFDQRGSTYDRVKQGNVDIGAYEVQGSRLTVRDFAYAEGNTAHVINVGVTLASASASTVSVDYTTADGTAVDGVDYTATSGNLTFGPGETSKLIPITILGNTKDEDDRTFTVNFSQTGTRTSELGDSKVVLTISDDDLAPRVSVAPANVSEGNTGITNLDFTVALSAASGKTVSVEVVSDAGTMAPAATPGEDYTPLSTTVTFAPGETSKTATVLVNGDTTAEADEHLRLTLKNPVNAYVKTPDNTADGVITNDDGPLPITISVNDRSVSESDTNRSVSFTVSLSAASSVQVTVHYATAEDMALEGQDYTGASGTLTFAPGETSKLVTLTVLGDTVDEDDETFFFNLDTPTNATIADGQGVATIVDNDPLPALSIDNVSLAEGNSGTTDFTFTVTLTGSTARTVSVVAQTAASSAPCATAGSDYIVAGPTTLTFAPGETTKTVTVQVNGDTAVETDEKFAVRLSGAVNAAVKTAFGIGTIVNDDAATLRVPSERVF